MKNIHILPTEKSSSLYREDDGTFGYDFVLKSYGGIDHYHMYITSDEEIKKGDWCLYNKNHNSINPNWELVKCGVIEREEMHPISNGRLLLWMVKIILATDLDLIIDGVQSIPDEFLEWFVKNPSCESVKIIRNLDDDVDLQICVDYSYNYKIIIPKKITRCCGRCNGVDDLCYSDMSCDVHKVLGCEECYGKRVEYKSNQQIIDEDFSGGLDMGQIIPKEDNHNYLPGFIQQFNPEDGELNNKDWSAVDFLKWLELNKFKIIK